MSKSKFNPNDPKQVGSLGLHIMGINDMPAEKWLSYFTSEDMKEYALNDDHGFIGRLAPHLQDKVTELLDTGYRADAPVRQHQMGAITSDKLKGAKVPLASVVKETVVTDKGVYTSIESLKGKLSGVYTIGNFDSVWVDALSLAGLDADIEYVSNVAKKKLLSSVKAAIVSAVENTVDNL